MPRPTVRAQAARLISRPLSVGSRRRSHTAPKSLHTNLPVAPAPASAPSTDCLPGTSISTAHAPARYKSPHRTDRLVDARLAETRAARARQAACPPRIPSHPARRETTPTIGPLASPAPHRHVLWPTIRPDRSARATFDLAHPPTA